MDRQKVSLVKCLSYDTAEVEAAVKRGVDLLGGVEAFIKPGEKVLIKPNLLMDKAPEAAITTHPEVVRAVIHLIKPVTKNIVCGDSPGVWGEKTDINRVYEVSGIKRVCDEEGIELVYFNQVKMVGGLPLSQLFFSCDKVVNVPKFKTHSYTVLTACLKNLYGCVVGMHKMKLHFDHPRPAELCRVILDIYEARQPDLNIVDGITAMEGDGPGTAGLPKKMNLIAAGRDGVAVDMVLARLMKCDGFDIPTNKEAARRGLGPSDPASIELPGGRLDDFIAADFKLPKSTVIAKLPPMPSWLSRCLMSFLALKPDIEISKCKLCGLCQKSCPAYAIRHQGNRMVFDRSQCILCYCCQEMCPHGAVVLKKSRLLRLLSGR